MMLRLLIDQDLDQDILRGLAQRIQGLDAITAYEAGLSEATDLELLAWAATEGRIIVSHDRKTMPGYAAERMARGEAVAGVILGAAAGAAWADSFSRHFIRLQR